MVRRTRARSITDDLAYPVRIKFKVPPHGLGRTLDEMVAWLKAELEPRDYAQHSQPAFACSSAAFYFRSIDVAARFVEAFPNVSLADGTTSPAFYSPAPNQRSIG